MSFYIPFNDVDVPAGGNRAFYDYETSQSDSESVGESIEFAYGGYSTEEDTEKASNSDGNTTEGDSDDDDEQPRVIPLRRLALLRRQDRAGSDASGIILSHGRVAPKAAKRRSAYFMKRENDAKLIKYAEYLREKRKKRSEKMGIIYRPNDTTLRHTLLRRRCESARRQTIADAVQIAQNVAQNLLQINAARANASAPEEPTTPHAFEVEMDAMLAADEAENQPEPEQDYHMDVDTVYTCIMDVIPSVEYDTPEEEAFHVNNYVDMDSDDDMDLDHDEN
ncbi:hypothetical protein F503_03288 [Ophiostoma piceae UAMH 11346]|uniref:Uncharacterized protein n=1 Tax=Ophiostoma piceae (strain UAMH 11346) TaxID=1262450 RepID=S3C4T8_OPHP1|nr:hypothetical protein F503_03288 [Ophiostoma piceae UAMH 11346]